MNPSLIKVSLPVLFVTAFTQCSLVERATNMVSDGPSVTNTTNAPDYFGNQRPTGNLNQIAAKVDGSIVTKNELNFMLSPLKQQISAQFPRKNSAYYTELSKAKKQVFEELIDRELILSEFDNLGGQIPDREVDREIKSRMDSLYNGNRSAYLADLKKNGLSQSKYRSLVKRNLAVGAMKSQHLNDFAPPTDSELNAEYSKFRDKMRDISRDKAAYKKIWIPLNSDELGATPDDQLSLAEDIVKRLRKGEDFSKLAREFSSDAYAAEGGQWPMTPRIDFPINFAPIVFNAPVGKLIGPLKDQHGFHIIKVTKKINGPSPPLSEVRTQLERRVKAAKSAERFQRWIKRLRSNAKIERYS